MSRCVRQWRYLRDMKRGGAGHTSTPAGEVGNGSLAVECPACPHPGRNLPTGWETEANSRAYVVTTSRLSSANGLCRWIYCLFLAIDANFRLKLKARGIKDPELGSGLAYFVDTIKFQEHLKNRAHEEDVSLNPHRLRMKMMTSIDQDLWGRVPCSKPGEFKAIKGFFSYRCWCDRLPSRLGS